MSESLGGSKLTAIQLEVWIQANLEALEKMAWSVKNYHERGELFMAGVAFGALLERAVACRQTSERWNRREK